MSQFFLTIPGGLFTEMKAEIIALASQTLESFEALNQEFGAIAYDAADLYSQYLHGQPIPGHGQLKHPIKSTDQPICRPLAALHWQIGHPSGEEAKRIEEGTPERDMKLSLPNAKKARMGKKGLYLVIPFRHGTPTAKYMNAMPPEVYRHAKALSFSYHQGQVGTRLSATGHVVPRYGYQWATGPKGSLPAGLAPKLKEGHKTDIYQGMYRFKDSGTTKQKKSAGYITFRTMSQGSPMRSWIRPAQPGLFPLETAMDQAWTANVENLNAAFWADIEVMWPGVTP